MIMNGDNFEKLGALKQKIMMIYRFIQTTIFELDLMLPIVKTWNLFTHS